MECKCFSVLSISKTSMFAQLISVWSIYVPLVENNCDTDVIIGVQISVRKECSASGLSTEESHEVNL